MRQINIIWYFEFRFFRTWSRLVTSHSGNTFNYATVPSWKKNLLLSRRQKESLDQEGEWWKILIITDSLIIMQQVV